MNVFEKFLWANRLKQVDVIKYLGISSAAVSSVAKGKTKFSKFNLVKLINNPYGWDTSMLVPLLDEDEMGSIIPRQQIEEPTKKQEELEDSGIGNDSWYRMMFVELSKRVAEQDATIARLQERIKELENK